MFIEAPLNHAGSVGSSEPLSVGGGTRNLMSSVETSSFQNWSDSVTDQRCSSDTVVHPCRRISSVIWAWSTTSGVGVQAGGGEAAISAMACRVPHEHFRPGDRQRRKVSPERMGAQPC